MAQKPKRDEMVTSLRGLSGSPGEMAQKLGVDAENATFKRALREVTAEGVLVPVGATRDRRYINRAEQHSEVTETAEVALLAVVPCTAQKFSTEGRKFIDDPKKLGEMKLRLGIETYKASDGRWHCRQVDGYTGPDSTAREEAGLVGPVAGERFAPLAAAAGRDGKTIGERAKAPRGSNES